MVSNSALAVSNLDFTAIQTSLINFLKANTAFKDYNFQGSNLSSLIQLLSYNTYLNAFYTNMAINEMFIDTAQLRDSVVSHSKELNYVPRSPRSAAAYVDIQIYPTDSPTYIYIPSGTSFSGTNGNNAYTFITNSSIIVTANNGNYYANSVEIFEGTLVTETFTVNSSITDQRFIMSNAGVDTSSLLVQVTDAFGNVNTWTEYSSLLGVSTNTQAWFLQAASNSNYEVLFGDNVAGQYPLNGANIYLTYRTCNSDGPNGITSYSGSSNVGGYTSFTVSTSNDANGNPIPSSGGSQAETISSIKFNAPRSFQDGNRAVISSDYSSILTRNFPEIDAIAVYGGEELTPPQYGKVYIAVDIAGSTGLSQIEANKLQSFISTKTFVITPVIISADYTYVSITSNIEYNLNVSNAAPSDIQGEILTAIENYNSNNLIDFNTTFRYSKLLAAIDNADSSITSNETTVNILKKISPTIGNNFTSILNYQNQLNPSSIYSSAFTYANTQCALKDDGIGNIWVMSENSANTSNIVKVGSVVYSTGQLSLANLNVTSYSGNSINIFAETILDDITVSQNVIIEIDESTTTINVTGVRE